MVQWCSAVQCGGVEPWFEAEGTLEEKLKSYHTTLSQKSLLPSLNEQNPTFTDCCCTAAAERAAAAATSLALLAAVLDILAAVQYSTVVGLQQGLWGVEFRCCRSSIYLIYIIM